MLETFRNMAKKVAGRVIFGPSAEENMAGRRRAVALAALSAGASVDSALQAQADFSRHGIAIVYGRIAGNCYPDAAAAQLAVSTEVAWLEAQRRSVRGVLGLYRS